MDPSAYLPPYSTNFIASATSLNNGQIPQGSKLATYMNRHTLASQPSASSGSALSVTDSMKTLNVSSIREFVPQPTASSPVPAFQKSTSSRSGAAVAQAVDFSGTDCSSTAVLDPSAANVDSAANVATFNEGGTTYFYSGNDISLGKQMANGSCSGSVILPNYTVYSGTPSHVAHHKTLLHTPSFMARSDIKLELLRRQNICLTHLDPEDSTSQPASVDNFDNLVPLEPVDTNPMHKSHSFGYTSSVYKAINTKSGHYVCLRRVHGFRLANTKCMVLVDHWKKMKHSNLVSLKQVFTTKAFGDHSMIFIYDFYPGADTLMDKHFIKSNCSFTDPFSGGMDSPRSFSQQKSLLLRGHGNNGVSSTIATQDELLPESLLWNYIIQLTAALRHIHSAGLACRTLDPSKILIWGESAPRLLLNCCGIFDILTFDPTSNPMSSMAHYQQEDLIALGKIMLALACNSLMAIQRENLQTSMEIVSSTYSNDMRNLIMYLLTNPTRVKSINDLMPMIGARFYNQLDDIYSQNDLIEMELAKEIESSRLFRLMTKLCTVVDRAELNGDYGWAEYGDCYILKLFRDYVFHQVMEDGRPWLDMAHVVSNLNKLDAAVSDRICLMSRDEQNVLVVSYGELRRCLEQCFNECIQVSKKGELQGSSV